MCLGSKVSWPQSFLSLRHMNDIDKLVVADAILFKPGLLEEEEYKVVKKQLQIGYEMPKHSQRDILIGGRDSCISAP